MKKTMLMAVAALAGVVIAADTKVGTIKFGNDLKITEDVVTHQSLAAYAKSADLGDLALLDTITLAKVSDAGTLAGKSSVAKTDLADAVQTSLGKADSAIQQADVTIAAAANGGLSVKVGTANASTALGTAAPTAATAYATAAQGTKADSALQQADVEIETAANGGLSVKVGTANASTALGTAATTASTAYATAAQGTKADSALQQADVAITESDNGGISVKVGSAEAETSLGSAATTASTAYATAAQGTKADAALPAANVKVNGTVSTTSTVVDLKALAFKDKVDADVIDVELGDYYLVDGTNPGDIDVMKRAAE